MIGVEEMAKIVVAGDTAIDWFMYPVLDELKSRPKSPHNWQLHAGMRAAALPGGSYLLAEFITHACDSGQSVCAPKPPKQLRVQPPDEVIHSNATLAVFRIRRERDGEKALRIRESLGYIGPRECETLRADPPKPDPPEADIVVLDDAGNGFRDGGSGDRSANEKGAKSQWPKALFSKSKPIVVHKMSRHLADGDLWDHLCREHHDRHILIVNARDLRENEAVQISRSLSWERTAKDFVFQICRSQQLQLLQQCPYVIVLFGTDGAIVYRGGEDSTATLVYDPDSLEGGFAASVDGSMNALTSVFTATLVAGIASFLDKQASEEDSDEKTPREEKLGGEEPATRQLAHLAGPITEAVKLGLARTRRFLLAGFQVRSEAERRSDGQPPASAGQDDTATSQQTNSSSTAGIGYPIDHVFHRDKRDESGECKCDDLGDECEAEAFASCEIEAPSDLTEADPTGWTILAHKTADTSLLAAGDIVLRGFDETSRLEGVPVGNLAN